MEIEENKKKLFVGVPLTITLEKSLRSGVVDVEEFFWPVLLSRILSKNVFFANV